VLEYGKDFSISNIKINELGTSFEYHSLQLDLETVRVNLLGKHQAYNAATAITAYIMFLQKTGRKLNTQKIYKALSNVNWQGRMQIISSHPTVIIDGAHNEEGINVLKNNLIDIFPNKKIYFVLAILRDKKLETIIKDICSVSYKIHITKNKSNRAAEIEDQVKFVKLYNKPYEVHEDVMKAVKKAISDADTDDIVMISGSLYTISEVIKERTSIIK
nr:hypothetical protein [Candidatus Cloacimonadota bacterium]